MRVRTSILAVIVTVGLSALALAQTPVGTAFTYQGRLTDGGGAANGAYDLRFTLYDAATGGAQVGPVVTRDDLAVTNGLFTAILDFGASEFVGSARFLEAAVRPGASSGSYTVLSPRQELTPAPHAVFSATAASANALQGRSVAASPPAGGQVLKWNGSAWSPAVDADTNSGGTVTGVATGAGLAGGPITGTGTVSVATGGITSALIANGAVGLAQINQAQVQARVGGACPPGQYLRGIGADGTVICEPVFVPNSLATLDPNAVEISVAMGTDGLPVIAYRDINAGALRVAKCGNSSCTTGNVLTTVDNDQGSNQVGKDPSIAIGTDGFPVISYQDNTAGLLKLAKCGNAACTAATVTVVDGPASYVGEFSSLAIAPDGLPVISYHDGTAGALKVAKCGNAACTNSNTITTVDVGNVGGEGSLLIGPDGLPLISYGGLSSSAVKVAKWGNPTCTAGNIITPVDTDTFFAREIKIAVGADGLPVLSYVNNTANTLKVAKCGNATCTAGNVVTTVDGPSPNLVGRWDAMAVGTDGLPVIAYPSLAGVFLLKVLKCGNAACNAGNVFTAVDDPANGVGSYTSMAMGADGLPLIVYRDETAGLKVAKCGTRSCR